MNKLSFLARRGNLISVNIAGTGKPLMLLHGFPLDHRMWAEQIEVLATNHRIIVPDLRGFGQSSLTDDPYSLADLADDVEQVREHLVGGEPMVLCGLSMGGYVCFEYWRKYSQHLSALILANTKPEADDESGKATRQAMIEKAEKEGGWQAVSSMLPKLLSKFNSESKSTIFQATEQMLRSASVEGVCRAQQAMSARQDFIHALPTITTPTLVITGEEDVIAPPAATSKWAAVIPVSQYQAISSAAHLTPLEQPQQFNRILTEFLSSLDD